MAVYFGADHVVWASQAGLYTNKQAVERCARNQGLLGPISFVYGSRAQGQPGGVGVHSGVPKAAGADRERCASELRN